MGKTHKRTSVTLPSTVHTNKTWLANQRDSLIYIISRERSIAGSALLRRVEGFSLSLYLMFFLYIYITICISLYAHVNIYIYIFIHTCTYTNQYMIVI